MSPTPLKLRNLDIRPIEHAGAPYFLLRDPMQLSDQLVAVPQMFGPFLMLCDGTSDLPTVEKLLASLYQVQYPTGMLTEVVNALDEAYLLDNDRAAAALTRAQADFRAAPFRPPSSADQSYPADPVELRQWLDELMQEANDVTPLVGNGRGLVSPHIDYARGGGVYARVWKRARHMVQEADLFILIGTDHFSDEPNSLTLTRQNYATPFGVLPTARNIVDELATALGPEKVFAGELRHRQEHSLELVAVWLHYLRGNAPCEIVPLLIGSFGEFIKKGVSPISSTILQTTLKTLRSVMIGRKALVIASGDLSHVGPAFGGEPLDAVGKAVIAETDQLVVNRICAGDAEGFYHTIQCVDDRTNICGLSPVYLTLKLLEHAEGEVTGYRICSADDEDTSIVTICGMMLE